MVFVKGWRYLIEVASLTKQGKAGVKIHSYLSLLLLFICNFEAPQKALLLVRGCTPLVSSSLSSQPSPCPAFYLGQCGGKVHQSRDPGWSLGVQGQYPVFTRLSHRHPKLLHLPILLIPHLKSYVQKTILGLKNFFLCLVGLIYWRLCAIRHSQNLWYTIFLGYKTVYIENIHCFHCDLFMIPV